MPSLQIRNLPEDIYQALSFRAEQAHRSLSQQALFELSAAASQSLPNQRLQALRAIKASLDNQGMTTPGTRPEDLLRADRER